MTDKIPQSRPILLEHYSRRTLQRTAQKFRLIRQNHDSDSSHEPGDNSDESESESQHNATRENKNHETSAVQYDCNGMDPSSSSEEDEWICDQIIAETDDENGFEDAESEQEDDVEGGWDESDEGEDSEDEESFQECMDELSFVDDDPLLYEGARITVGESLLAVLSLFLRHSLTGACLADVLKLLELHCIAPNRCKKSLYLFKKYFENIYAPLKRHFYCSTCYSPLKGAKGVCDQCPTGTEVCYFIEISVINQLETLYRRFDFIHQLQARFNRKKYNVDNYEDIYDGKIYKKLTQCGGFLSNDNNISLTWNTDGVPLFKSSNFQIWPFFFAVNELPLHERTKKENLLLAGLWFGPKKPFPGLFLEPISEDLQQLNNGVNFEVPSLDTSILVQATVICGTCDLPAKALFLNMKQYNGEYGCQKCKIRSERFEQTSIRVYPFRRHLNDRTQEETNESAARAVQTGEASYGVKGPSAVSRFSKNYIQATAVDEMHAVFLGIVKALLVLWFSSKFSQENWSLSKSIKIVDKYICAIKPPAFVSRLPRSIALHMKYFKASELKAWFYYYSVPILRTIMPAMYFEHYLLLLNAISLLNQSSVSTEEIDIAEELLMNFVARFADLYHKRFMSANLHLLLHLAQTVRDFGPLWVTSCFSFENANGQLKKMATGTRFSGLQICTGLSYLMAIPELLQNLVPNSIVREFCNRLNNFQGKYKYTSISSNLCAIGVMGQRNRIPDIILEVLHFSNIIGSNLGIFHRLMKSRILYTSDMYRRSTKTNSTCVKYNLNDECHFGIIRCFLRVSDCICRSFCGAECDVKYIAIIKTCNVHRAFNNRHNQMISRFYHFNVTDNIIAVDVSNLLNVCFYLKVSNDNVYIVEPVNTIEKE